MKTYLLIMAIFTSLPVQAINLFCEQNLSTIHNIKQALEIRLPYVYTPNITLNVQPAKVNIEFDYPCKIIQAKISDSVQVIPTKAPVESWHNLVVFLKGDYFVLLFKTEKLRSEFLKLIQNQSVIEEGVTLDNQYVVVLDVKQFFKIKTQLAKIKSNVSEKIIQSKIDEVPLVQKFESFGRVTEDHLVRVSNRYVETFGNTKYYFRDNEVVGYVKNGEAIILLRSHGKETESSHAQILRKQGIELKSDISDMQKPIIEFEAGRKRVANLLAHWDLNTSQIKELTLYENRVDTLIKDYEKNKVSAYQFNILLPIRLTDLIKFRLNLHSATMKKSLGVLKKIIPDIERFNSNPFALVNSDNFFRFVWIKGVSIDSGGMIFIEGNMLHDQMLLLALGEKIINRYLTNAKGHNVLRNFVRGGLFKMENRKGDIPEIHLFPNLNSIRLPQHNEIQGSPITMTNEEWADLHIQIQAAIFGSINER
ncbi:MAG: hypothetical protein SGI74_00400 [Oligoflexia bacterium]|nr:hypothetical protein [Oligoflexia bacterium]